MPTETPTDERVAPADNAVPPVHTLETIEEAMRQAFRAGVASAEPGSSISESLTVEELKTTILGADKPDPMAGIHLSDGLATVALPGGGTFSVRSEITTGEVLALENAKERGLRELAMYLLTWSLTLPSGEPRPLPPYDPDLPPAKRSQQIDARVSLLNGIAAGRVLQMIRKLSAVKTGVAAQYADP